MPCAWDAFWTGVGMVGAGLLALGWVLARVHRDRRERK